MNKTFKNAMVLGNLFWKEYENDERIYEWCGSEECSTFARLILDYANKNKIDIDVAYDTVKEKLINDINNDEINIEEHMWDNICKGFLAGEILGEPNEVNLSKVREADRLWKDEGYGYYQEVLNEVA